jgi:hypothetical protein
MAANVMDERSPSDRCRAEGQLVRVQVWIGLARLHPMNPDPSASRTKVFIFFAKTDGLRASGATGGEPCQFAGGLRSSLPPAYALVPIARTAAMPYSPNVPA